MMNDAEALKLAIQGREDGFRAIFAGHSAFMFTHALRLLKDRQLAEDAVQETFTAAFRSIASFRGEARLRTWLYQILYRNAIRLAGKRQPLPPANMLEACQQSETEAVDARNDVGKVLDQLGERDRMILLLTYWDELPLKEAARILEVSENNAKIILFRARSRFASLWSAASADRKDRENHAV